jgi:hypothetical protein
MWLGTPKDFRYVKPATSCVSLCLCTWNDNWKDMVIVWSRWNKHGKDAQLKCVQISFYGPWKLTLLTSTQILENCESPFYSSPHFFMAWKTYLILYIKKAIPVTGLGGL